MNNQDEAFNAGNSNETWLSFLVCKTWNQNKTNNKKDSQKLKHGGK